MVLMRKNLWRRRSLTKGRDERYSTKMIGGKGERLEDEDKKFQTGRGIYEGMEELKTEEKRERERERERQRERERERERRLIGTTVSRLGRS